MFLTNYDKFVKEVNAILQFRLLMLMNSLKKLTTMQKLDILKIKLAILNLLVT